ncbi:hypothetical protein E2C01_065783 [Portunus trituberculatus]|uniref:Uncharacterized protein n=1 Tax=Portunus trituberculatus TaxID=210409 RepID=A0A5B7HNI2_PORTR|nr:hypothetical protein [Portunus trituberculatus]
MWSEEEEESVCVCVCGKQDQQEEQEEKEIQLAYQPPVAFIISFVSRPVHLLPPTHPASFTRGRLVMIC